MGMRVARFVRLKRDKIDDYLECHKSVPEAVIRELKKAGISNFSIYIQDDALFSYMETKGPAEEVDFAQYLRNPECKKWEELMKTFQTGDGNPDEGIRWVPSREVFHMD
jgi:L-rhamnose mutarotase